MTTPKKSTIFRIDEHSHDAMAYATQFLGRCRVDTYITNECGRRITGSELEEILNRRRKEKENMMKLYQVFFVDKESRDVMYEYVAADSREVAVMKAASNVGVDAEHIDNYEIKVLTHFELD